jgi:hypothetical protein
LETPSSHQVFSIIYDPKTPNDHQMFSSIGDPKNAWWPLGVFIDYKSKKPLAAAMCFMQFLSIGY